MASIYPSHRIASCCVLVDTYVHVHWKMFHLYPLLIIHYFPSTAVVQSWSKWGEWSGTLRPCSEKTYRRRSRSCPAPTNPQGYPVYSCCNSTSDDVEYSCCGSVCVCVCVCVCACVRACVRACVHACVRVCAAISTTNPHPTLVS